MKRAKKILAMILSLAMVMAMSLTAFGASSGLTPDQVKTGKKVVVWNVSANSTVMAYQIVKYDLNGNYEVVEQLKNNSELGYKNPLSANDVGGVGNWAPTPEDIQKIAAMAAKGDLGAGTKLEPSTEAEFQNAYTANLAVGMWVVLVKSGSNTIYNPMIVSVQVLPDGTLSGGNVNAGKQYFEAFAKSDVPTLDKKITGSTTPLKDGTASDNTDTTLKDQAKENGNDVAIGDTVNFEIDAQIPAYTEAYTEVIVTISDNLSKGLSLNSVPVVKVGDDTLKDGEDYDYDEDEPTPPDGDVYGYKITLHSDKAIKYSGQKLTVTYTALLTDKAGANFNPNTNTATFEYTNNPLNANDTKKLDDKTYTYTFEIDGNLYGEGGGTWDKVTEELLKGYKKTTTETGKWELFEPLKDAEFKLTNNKTGKEYTTKSDGAGLMNFKGLDAGSYTLVETKAPNGYTLNTTPIPVEIVAEYNADGTLKSYTITVDGKDATSTTYTATYNTDDPTKKGVITDVKTSEIIEKTDDHDASNSYIFWNTKLSSLPSTGGIGTTIFTIGGCIIMIIAAGLFFASRRKKAEN